MQSKVKQIASKLKYIDGGSKFWYKLTGGIRSRVMLF